MNEYLKLAYEMLPESQKEEVNEFIQKIEDIWSSESPKLGSREPVLGNKSKTNVTKVFILKTICNSLKKDIKVFRQETKPIIVGLGINTLINLVRDDWGAELGRKHRNNNGIPLAFGNIKLGENILTLNCSPALICPSDIDGKCKNCSVCYAKASEQRQLAELLRNLYSLVNILILPTEVLVRETLKELKGLNQKKVKNLRFIRISVNGDIWDTDSLKKLVQVTKTIMNMYKGIISTYTYTHNKKVNWDKKDHIVVNFSDEADDGLKHTEIWFKWSDELLDHSKYAVCIGICKHCPYCKNKDDLRCVKFGAHGGGLNAKATAPKDVLDDLYILGWIESKIFEFNHSKSVEDNCMELVRANNWILKAETKVKLY